MTNYNIPWLEMGDLCNLIAPIIITAREDLSVPIQVGDHTISTSTVSQLSRRVKAAEEAIYAMSDMLKELV